ncbi:DNA-binding Lrp family transcriptional regulator [Sinorhizobium fredii]
MKLDRIDIKILSELQKNGRMTYVELAELVNLSATPCLVRVKKLQAEGYIGGYSAMINMGKLGQVLTVFTEITLRNHRHADIARFMSAIQNIEQVIECHVVSGDYEYLVKFVASSIGEYQSLMRAAGRNGHRNREILQFRRAQIANHEVPYAPDEPVRHLVSRGSTGQFP